MMQAKADRRNGGKAEVGRQSVMQDVHTCIHTYKLPSRHADKGQAGMFIGRKSESQAGRQARQACEHTSR